MKATGYSELCDRECAPSNSAVDVYGRKKLLYHRAAHAFSSVYAVAKRTETGADITVINYRRTELSGRLYYRIIDSGNNLVYNYAEEITVPPVSSATFSADLDEYISGREKKCYLEYGVSSLDAQYTDTLLFVKPKEFIFERPDIKLRVDGSDTDFSLTLSSNKYTAGVEVTCDGADIELSDAGFDITSPAPVKLIAKLKSGKLTAQELESRIRINSLNTVGIEN